MNLIRKYSNI